MNAAPGSVRGTVMRHLGKNNRPPRKPPAVDSDGDAIDYRDTTPFKAYCLVVASVLSDELKPIRAINQALGDRIRPHWTADALERVADLHEGYIDRFTARTSETRV